MNSGDIGRITSTRILEAVIIAALTAGASVWGTSKVQEARLSFLAEKLDDMDENTKEQIGSLKTHMEGIRIELEEADQKQWEAIKDLMNAKTRMETLLEIRGRAE